MKKNIKLIGLLSFALLGGVLTSCGQAKDQGGYINEEKTYIDGDKIVYIVDLEFETDNAKELEIEIKGKILEFGGFVAYANEIKDVDYFRSNVTYKIPVENLDSFESYVDTKDSLISKTKNMENVTGEYVSKETTIKALEDKLELYNTKYLEATDLDQQLALLDIMSEIEYQIAKERNSMEAMNNKINYSTINAIYRTYYSPSRKSEYFDYLSDVGSKILWSLAYSAPFIILAGIGVTIFACIKKKKLDKNK